MLARLAIDSDTPSLFLSHLTQKHRPRYESHKFHLNALPSQSSCCLVRSRKGDLGKFLQTVSTPYRRIFQASNNPQQRTFTAPTSRGNNHRFLGIAHAGVT